MYGQRVGVGILGRPVLLLPERQSTGLGDEAATATAAVVVGRARTILVLGTLVTANENVDDGCKEEEQGADE